MQHKNQTIMKLAQTALLAALCFVSFTFSKLKYRCREAMQRPFILEMLSVYWRHCC